MQGPKQRPATSERLTNEHLRTTQHPFGVDGDQLVANIYAQLSDARWLIGGELARIGLRFSTSADQSVWLDFPQDLNTSLANAGMPFRVWGGVGQNQAWALVEGMAREVPALPLAIGLRDEETFGAADPGEAMFAHDLGSHFPGWALLAKRHPEAFFYIRDISRTLLQLRAVSHPDADRFAGGFSVLIDTLAFSSVIEEGQQFVRRLGSMLREYREELAPRVAGQDEVLCRIGVDQASSSEP